MKKLKLPLLLGILIAGASANARSATAPANFSGVWQQDNDRCQPRAHGDVKLVIQHEDPTLKVEIDVQSGSSPGRKSEKSYSTKGEEAISKDEEGDEIRTTVAWSGQSLIFNVEEHEDERVLRTKETWTLIDGGKAIQRVRQNMNSNVKQTLIYVKTER